jgi:hypothetical protein
VLDIDRQDANQEPDRHENVSIEIGAPANPPGFDANLVGLAPGDDKTFSIHFPADYAVKEMADTDVTYTVKVKDVRRKVLPELDDEFAEGPGCVRLARGAARQGAGGSRRGRTRQRATTGAHGDPQAVVRTRVTF